MNRYLLTIFISLITITCHAQIVETNGKRSINDVQIDKSVTPQLLLYCEKEQRYFTGCNPEDIVLISQHKPVVFKRKDGSWQIEFLP